MCLFCNISLNEFMISGSVCRHFDILARFASFSASDFCLQDFDISMSISARISARSSFKSRQGSRQGSCGVFGRQDFEISPRSWQESRRLFGCWDFKILSGFRPDLAKILASFSPRISARSWRDLANLSQNFAGQVRWAFRVLWAYQVVPWKYSSALR